MEIYDTLVIGGGIVGMSVAYHLVGHGLNTLLIDRADPGRATDAGAGILGPEVSGKDSETWFDFAVEAVAYYPTLLADLEANQDGDTGYAPCARLTLAIDEDEQVPYEQAKRVILTRQERRGRPDRADLHPLSPEEAHQLCPALAPVRGAIYFRHAARLDARPFTAAMQRVAEQRGLTTVRAGVERLVLSERAIAGVVADGHTYSAGRVVIAGGAWSAAFGEQIGLVIPVEPQRGQIIHLHLPDVDTAGWPIVSAMRDHYIVPWPDGRIVAGATREHGSGFVPQTTAAGIYQVLAEALRVMPGLSQARIAELRVGLRPLSADGLPVLGEVPGVPGLYLATGHGPTGLQLGPYSGKLVADLIAGEPLSSDLDQFQVARFL